MGASEEECESLMQDLNYNFWSDGVDDKRFEGYINQMRRAYGAE